MKKATVSGNMNDIHIKDNGMPFVSPSDEICAGRDGNSACYRDAMRKQMPLAIMLP